MIIAKERTDSNLFKGLKFLDKRTTLDEESRKQLINLKKGIKGEDLFDALVKKVLNKNVLVLHDLLLIHNGSTFQIDSLLITSSAIYLYEIKNYQGNFINDNGHFMTNSGKEINNPTTQLKRTETLLRKVLMDMDFDYEVKGYVVFTHPTFYLYQAVDSDPFIFSPQFESHFRSVNSQSRPLSTEHEYVSDTLIRLQREEAPYQKQLPDYTYQDFKKGINCSQCTSLNTRITQRRAYCNECGYNEELSKTIIQNMKQFRFLFPEIRLTSAVLSDWMGESVKMARLACILKKECIRMGYSKGTYYIDKGKIEKESRFSG